MVNKESRKRNIDKRDMKSADKRREEISLRLALAFFSQ